MGDLFDWALSMARGEERWRNSAPLSWAEEAQRFFSALEAFDRQLALPEPIHVSEGRGSASRSQAIPIAHIEAG
jgi:hypothetical protein